MLIIIHLTMPDPSEDKLTTDPRLSRFIFCQNENRENEMYWR